MLLAASVTAFNLICISPSYILPTVKSCVQTLLHEASPFQNSATRRLAVWSSIGSADSNPIASSSIRSGPSHEGGLNLTGA